MNLCYTTAFDPPGELHQRLGAKLLVSSLLRTGFGGDIVVITNSECPVYFLDRKGVEEIVIDFEEADGATAGAAASAWRFLAAQHIRMEQYERVLFAAPGTLVLRNIDHLLAARWRYAYSEVPGCGSVDEGLFAMAGAEFANAAQQLLEADSPDEVEAASSGIDSDPDAAGHCEPTAWSRFIETRPHGTRRLELGEVCYPFGAGVSARATRDAAVLRAHTGSWDERLSFLFGNYMAKFFWEESGTLLNVLEP